MTLMYISVMAWGGGRLVMHPFLSVHCPGLCGGRIVFSV